MFTDKEIRYIKTQPLGRLATISADNQPDNSPISYECDGNDFFISGRNLSETRKYKNIDHGQKKVALVIYDLETIDPWKPRGIRIFGTAEIVERSGRYGAGVYLHIKPTVSWSWNIELPAFDGGKFVTNKTVHRQENP